MQKKFIDFAADMKWEYCLIDVDWDTKIGYGKMQELADYAKSKNVGLILWYNSAGDWNTVKYTPKNKLTQVELLLISSEIMPLTNARNESYEILKQMYVCF